MQKIYCDIGFLEKFTETFPVSISPIDSSISKMKCYLNIFDLISRSAIEMNISIRDFMLKIEKDQWLKTLWKKSTEGNCKLDFNENDFLELFGDLENENENENETLNSIFLLGNQLESLREKCEGHGLLVIDITEIENNNHLFIDQGSTIDRSQTSRFIENCWSVLNRARHKCNSMIIIDPYILSDPNNYNANIYLILKKFLPNSLETEFHLTIITKSNTINLQNKYGIIDNYISQIRPNLSYSFNICGDNRFHDRLILTNYMLIKCGAGFSIYRRIRGEFRAQNPTDISIIYPKIQNSIQYAEELYNTNIRLVNRSFNDIAIGNGNAQLFGSNTRNRLLSQ